MKKYANAYAQAVQTSRLADLKDSCVVDFTNCGVKKMTDNEIILDLIQRQQKKIDELTDREAVFSFDRIHRNLAELNLILEGYNVEELKKRFRAEFEERMELGVEDCVNWADWTALQVKCGKKLKERPMADKLKPCPFCGGEARLTKRVSDYDGTIFYGVQCVNTGCCEIPAIYTESAASSKWNKRKPIEIENGEARVWLYSDPKNMARVLDEQSRKEVEVLERLAHYEDLEEAGRLIELPCAIGDITYWIGTEDEDGNEGLCVMESEPVRGILCTKDGFYVEIDTRTFSKVGSSDCLLTRAEAEEMLERIKSDG